MKKITLFLALLFAGMSVAMAGEKTTINRMVLKAVKDFDQVVVSGDVTVELRYNPEKEGYIVYHYDKKANKTIRCFNQDNVLHVQGSADAVMSRIVVFYGDPITSIIHNGDARLVAHRLKCDPESIAIILNGDGDVKFGRMKTKNAHVVVNNTGDLSVEKVKVDNFDVVINGSGNVILRESPKSLNLTKNGIGTVKDSAEN